MPKETPLSITAESLAKEFKAGKDAAKAKYTGKRLEIEGNVHDVYGTEISGEPTLILWGFQEKPATVPLLIQCYFPAAQQGRINNFKKDQKVKIRGLCVETPSSISGTFVWIKECEVVP